MNRDEFNWTDDPVLGLTIKGGIDSNGNKIEDGTYYLVGKHKDGKVMIIPEFWHLGHTDQLN